MEKMIDLKDLLKHEIQDLYSVEEQIIEALPKMIEKANHKILKNALSEHLRITEEQKTRLEKIQQMMNEGGQEENGKKKKGILSGLFGGTHVCKGMKGIIDEGNKVIGEDMTPEVLDAAIIACVQKVEHYEICGYGTARTYARELGMEQVAKMLEQTLSEEYQADDRLTELAVTRINLEAETAGGQSGDSTASGSRQRSGRETSRERIATQERELEPVSTRNSSSGRTASATKKTPDTERGGQPKASSASPRSSGAGRGTASAKKTTGNSRGSKTATKSSGRNSGTSGGRGSTSTGRGRR